MIAKVDALAELTPAGAIMIAHSAGAVPAVLAVANRRISIAHLVLLEPALYDIARGVPAIEQHIGGMTQARAHAAAGDMFAFWSIVRPMMFGGSADREQWRVEREIAERFATIELPWGHGVTASMIADVPTLVITGDWNDEYEAIATALAARGAVHRHLVGNQHRPQDHPGFENLVWEFLDR